MARIRWVPLGIYENGLSRGVLYPYDEPAVPWDGLTKVEERNTGAKLTTQYYEGEAYRVDSEQIEHGARIGAYTYPEAMERLVGKSMDEYGIQYGTQPNGYFAFSYRTEVTDGYKIHLYLNQKATPVDVTRATASSTPEALEFMFDTAGVPVRGLKRPTAYLVFDSRRVDPSMMSMIEGYLYGTRDSDPTALGLIQFLRDVEFSTEGFVIARSDEEEWTILGPDEKIDVGEEQFKIQDIDHEYTSEGIYKLFEDEE